MTEKSFALSKQNKESKQGVFRGLKPFVRYGPFADPDAAPVQGIPDPSSVAAAAPPAKRMKRLSTKAARSSPAARAPSAPKTSRAGGVSQASKAKATSAEIAPSALRDIPISQASPVAEPFSAPEPESPQQVHLDSDSEDDYLLQRDFTEQQLEENMERSFAENPFVFPIEID
ncbi:hypothetical protein E9993_23360, partial [Labilibacter sediminis]